MSIVSIKYLRRKWNVLGIIAIVAVLLDVFGVDAMGGGPGIVCPPCYTGDECFYYICTCDSCWGCNNSTGECSVRKCNPVDCKACKMVAGHCVGCMVCSDDPNKTCCSGTPSGKCCRKPYCEECVDGNCKVCGGEPNQACCDGTCYDTITQKCCRETTPAHICPKDHQCCQGTCCPGECCEGEYDEPLCHQSMGCGCDPINASCSEKKERQPGDAAYYAYGTGSKCKIFEGIVTCYKWRYCTEAGYHYAEFCWCANPHVPECYCTAYVWPYCQDCIGEGEWENNTAPSYRCVSP